MSLGRKSLRRLSSAASSTFSLSHPAPIPDLPPPTSTDSLVCSLQGTKTKVILRLIEGGKEVWVIKIPGGESGEGGGEGGGKATRIIFKIPTLNILSITHPSPTSPLLIHITYLSNAPSYTPTHLFLHLPSPSSSNPPVSPTPFLDELSKAAYPDPKAKRKRRVLLIVNPAGGKGRALKSANNVVLPILEAAGCTVEMILTTHNGHGREIARDLDVDAFDVIGTVSGDGIIHELYNGFATRPDALKCFRLPLVPVPAGTGNSLSISIHGKIDGFSIPLSALNLVKGTPLVMDLCSINQGDKPRLISFLSVALGVMADLDIGTENLRWMGDTRFVYGLLRNTITMPTWRGTLSIKIHQPLASKSDLAAQLRARLAASSLNASSASLTSPPTAKGAALLDVELDDGPLPEALRIGDEEERDGWLRIVSGEDKNEGSGGEGKATREDLLYVYSGILPMASRDLLQWPFAAPGEGLIDLVVQPQIPRTLLLKNITTADSGGVVLEPSQRYYKASAFHVSPSPSSGTQLISIDGESLSSDDGPFTVECLQGLGRTMGLRGRWEGGDDFWKKGFLEREGAGGGK